MDKSLVIVDDSADVLADVRAVLEDSCWRVTVCTSAAVFQKMLSEWTELPTCVLVEPNLPDDSIRVAEVLSRDFPHVPVIGISTNPDSAAVQRLRSSGVQTVLRKPLVSDQFATTLAALRDGRTET